MCSKFTQNQHARRMWTLHEISTALQAICDTTTDNVILEQSSKRQTNSINNGPNSQEATPLAGSRESSDRDKLAHRTDRIKEHVLFSPFL